MKTLLLVAMLAGASARAGTLVSVDWKNPDGISRYGSYSGVEPLAAAANPAFGAASVWNDALLGFLSPVTNPSFSGLVDNSGNTTGIGIQLTGSVDTYTGHDGSCPNSLFCDFIYLNSGSVGWRISGLIPRSTVSLYFYNYGSPDQPYRAFNMAVDADASGSLDANYTVAAVAGGYASGILADASGTITGQMQCCASGQASWSGLQIYEETPEPGTLGFSIVGLLALVYRMRKPGESSVSKVTGL